ncbi:MAG: DUF2723 domain-containing protein [Endomicrobia bacterium]|nr:DUF2723 domain-containing protein [Endomicrobiia bacterium]
MWKVYAIIFGVFVILLYCCSPSVNSGDSGEFITTSCTLGIAHSPGYPLYCLLGKIFCFLIPFGTFAYRVNLMNIILTFLLSFIIYLWSNKHLDDRQKSLVAVLVLLNLIFSTSYFRNTVQTEVFILNTVSVVAILILLQQVQRNEKLIYLIIFIFAISLGNHHTVIFVLPSIIYILFCSKLSIKKILYCVLFFMFGFSVYIFLPIRASKEPYFNWGNAKNLTNLYRVITRKDYGTFQLTVDKPIKLTIHSVYLQIKRFVSKSVEDLTIVIFISGILSFYIIFSKNQKLFWILFIPYILSGIGFLILANLPFEPIHDGILERFYIMPNTILIVAIVFALDFLPRRSLLTLGIVILYVLSVVYQINKNFIQCNYRNYYLNYDYGMNIFRSMLPNSILFMDGGDDTFYTLGYLQAVEKKRLDVSLHDRGGLVFKNIYGEDFRKLTPQEKNQRRILIESSYVKQRPVFYSTFNKNILPGYTLTYAGVIYAVKTNLTQGQIDERIFKEIYSYRGVFENYYDYRSKALVPIYHFMEATNSEDTFKCFNLLKYSYYLWPEVDWLKNNIVVELHNCAYREFNKSNYEFCKDIYEFILKVNPNDLHGLLNLGVTYEKMDDLDKAVLLYNKVLEIDKSNVTAYYNLAALYWKKSDWDNVIRYFNEVLKLQPNNEQVRAFLYRAMIEKNKTNKK